MASYDDDNVSKLMRKIKQNPSVPIGFAGCAAIVAHQLYKMKTRGDTKMSVYLIRMRVAAQGFVVGSITIGVLYSMFTQYVIGPMKSRKEENTSERGL
ncbi:HIG1 domain family member 1A, mitochondrial [Austrofundulus limnaeus]|uniref:HIG1 domain family member 1A, mitochondrial n=1 Tax=Austrofundulus limnaeus TaxID=52670 RepID=A0A2I4CY67_AUSLI|nr:PREDICTED: HIG1 domain family member 1A, mitochondrial [Austrofundulus limnaeus]